MPPEVSEVSYLQLYSKLLRCGNDQMPSAWLCLELNDLLQNLAIALASYSLVLSTCRTWEGVAPQYMPHLYECGQKPFLMPRKVVETGPVATALIGSHKAKCTLLYVVSVFSVSVIQFSVLQFSVFST